MEILEFRNFLAKACKHISIKKLRNRIYRELCEHMEDILDDFLEAGEEKDTAIQKVITEMGDPVKINKNLRRAHRKKIVSSYILKTAIGIFAIISLLHLPYLDVGFSEYFSSITKEQIETDLAESEYTYTYYGETERNGRNYIFYIAETSEEHKVKYFESIKLFGKHSVYVRFSGSGGGSSDGNLLMSLGFPDIKSENETYVYFSFKPIKAKYFKVGFQKYDYSNTDTPENVISDFIAVPNIGEFVIIDAPDGYRFSGFYYPYDENKQLIEYSDPDTFSSGESWKGGMHTSYSLWRRKPK